MNLSDIIEINEIARIRAGVLAPPFSGQDANVSALEGCFPVYTAMRRRSDPTTGGAITSQMNTMTEYIEYAVTGNASFVNASYQRETVIGSSYLAGLSDLSPMRMRLGNTSPNSTLPDPVAWVDNANDEPHMSPPVFVYEQGSTYQVFTDGNYTPMMTMLIPVRNSTDTDITIPASKAYFSGTSTYGQYGMAIITAASANPTLTDAPTITNLVNNVNGNHNPNISVGSFTIPAGKASLIVMFSHLMTTKSYSNSRAHTGVVGPQSKLWYYLTNTEGLLPDYNAGYALLLGKPTAARSYSELFVSQEDLFTGEK
jgi:hypothetical protein